MRLAVGRSLGRLGFELFLVFVAVSAALWANAWWQDRRDVAAGQAALAAFADEMRANLAQIDERIEHHRLVYTNCVAMLEQIVRGDELPRDIRVIRDRLTDKRGMRTPVLSRAAWDSALAAGALGNLPFGTVRSIAVVYEVQRHLERVLTDLMSNFTEPSYFDASRIDATITALMVTFSMIVELETEQVASYRRCIALVERG